jgi:LmbE family N-acetylglucosaminyl deacetylase
VATMGLTLVVSPHLDDAVFSVGQLLATLDDPVVVTVCAGSQTTRRAEDVEAAEQLGYQPVHLDFADNGAEPLANITQALADVIASRRPEHLIGPLGVRHPDHIRVAAGFLAAARLAAPTVHLYEELPYRVLWPEMVAPALAHLHTIRLSTSDLPDEATLAAKQRAIDCYRSQLSGMNTRALSMPERLWTVTP